jgi:hypothetical protein
MQHTSVTSLLSPTVERNDSDSCQPPAFPRINL